jgi:hypothetical protein
VKGRRKPFSNQSGYAAFNKPVSPPSYGVISYVIASSFRNVRIDGLMTITPALKLSGGKTSGAAAISTSGI